MVKIKGARVKKRMLRYKRDLIRIKVKNKV